jgi:hypothetical protein
MHRAWVAARRARRNVRQTRADTRPSAQRPQRCIQDAYFDQVYVSADSPNTMRQAAGHIRKELRMHNSPKSWRSMQLYIPCSSGHMKWRPRAWSRVRNRLQRDGWVVPGLATRGWGWISLCLPPTQYTSLRARFLCIVPTLRSYVRRRPSLAGNSTYVPFSPAAGPSNVTATTHKNIWSSLAIHMVPTTHKSIWSGFFLHGRDFRDLSESSFIDYNTGWNFPVFTQFSQI